MPRLPLRTIADAPDEIKRALKTADKTNGFLSNLLPVGRRDLLRTLTTVGVAAVATAGSDRPAAAETATSNRGKRRSLYQANAAEVKTFYRVNGYPAN
jgi:hypothetical protein